LSGPRRLDFGSGAAPDAALEPVIEHLRSGGIVAYPTETVYGLGCLLRDEPLARLRALKQRDGDAPFLLLVPDADSVQELTWTEGARALAMAFWPGPVTLMLADERRIFPAAVRGPEGAVAVRQSGHPLAQRLVERLGEPLTSTSANPRGGDPASDGDGAWSAVLALGAGEEMWVLDGGGLPESPPSTIVDCTGRVPRVRRVGATPVLLLRRVLPDIESPEAGVE